MPPVPRRIFPLEEPPPPPPEPVAPSTARRDGLLVAGLTVLGTAAALGVLGTILDLVALADGTQRSGLVRVSVALQLVTDLVLVGAWAAAVQAFRVRLAAARSRLLVLAAALVVVGTGVEILAAAFSAAADVDDDLPGTALGSDLVGLTSSIVLLATAAVAAAAFAGPRDARDQRLAWAAIGFGASSALGMIAGALVAIAFADLGYGDKLTTGIWLSGIGQVFAVAGAALAGAGLLTRERREVLLPVGLGLWALTGLVGCIGSLISASAMRGEGYESLDVIGVRIGALAALITAVGALVVAAAFRPPPADA